MGNCLGTNHIENQIPSMGEITSNNGGSTGEAFLDEEKVLGTPNLKIFSFEELKRATRNFRPTTVLGEHGFGSVFKGVIDEKTYCSQEIATSSSSSGALVIAVKILHRGSLPRLEEWKSEVNFLGTLSHPNLVKLLGCCWEDENFLLVHEFMQKGSLENHLFRRGSDVQPLSWGIRLKIAIGAAQGLAYLYSFEKQVIYGEFKASKILLDENFNSKLSDFGFTENDPVDDCYSPTERCVPFQQSVYKAPEYAATGELHVKSDVYGFGVVLLEILTGQRALDSNRPVAQRNLVDWMKPSLADPRKLGRVMDPRLEGQYPPKGATLASQLVWKCLQSDPRVRPSMNEVVEALKKIEARKEEKPRTPKPSTKREP